MEQEYARFRQTHPPTLSSEVRDAIRSLAKNLPALWHAATTTSADRQRIVRLLLERAVVNLREASACVDVTFQWAGGFATQHEFIRPVLRCDQVADYDRMVDRILELRDQGWSFVKIAEQLNQEGFRPAKRAEKFDNDMVSRLVRKLEQKGPGERVLAPRKSLNPNEWLVIDLAEELGIARNTLFNWINRGWVHVVRQSPGYHGRVICWANQGELDRLRRLRQTNHGWWGPPLPSELTTPKVPPTV